MKIAVYTIALNEEQFVERWYNSAKDADYLLIADTGSTDLTVKYAKNYGINVINIGIKPWRFDDARNAALAALPLDIDYCIALDMDEILLPGWKKEIESLDPEVTRPRYEYTWSWNDDKSPGLVYGGDKIHSRRSYRWKHPVHEVLVCQDREIQSWTKLQIHHYPDQSKSRGQYFPLLELAVREDPYDDRNAFYYARELYFNNLLQLAAREFKRHLELPKATWKPERAASMKYLAKCEPEKAQYWLAKAIEEAPGHREALYEMSLYLQRNKFWEQSIYYAELALKIKDKPLEYLCEAEAWGWGPYDAIAVASFYLGKKEQALEQGKIALELNPNDQRLKKNLEFYLN